MTHWLIYLCLGAPAQPAPPALPQPSAAAPPAASPGTSSPFPEPAPEAAPQNRTPANRAPQLPPRPPTVAPPAPQPQPERVRRWNPPAQLVEVPFPLERRETPVAENRRRRAPMVDLRDPFVTGGRGRPLPAHLRARLLPDLKDPFVAPRHPRPEGWKVALPGDIRDPFAERNMRPTTNCGGVPQSTSDGVSIQRPGTSQTSTSAAASQPCRRQVRTMPADLQDPFRRPR